MLSRDRKKLVISPSSCAIKWRSSWLNKYMSSILVLILRPWVSLSGTRTTIRWWQRSVIYDLYFFFWRHNDGLVQIQYDESIIQQPRTCLTDEPNVMRWSCRLEICLPNSQGRLANSGMTFVADYTTASPSKLGLLRARSLRMKFWT